MEEKIIRGPVALTYTDEKTSIQVYQVKQGPNQPFQSRLPTGLRVSIVVACNI